MPSGKVNAGAVSTPGDASTSTDFAVTVMRRTQATFWILVATLYALNASASCTLASLYANALVPGALINRLVAVQLRGAPQRFVVQYHEAIAGTYAVLGALYLYPLAVMMWQSFRQCRLIFQAAVVPSRGSRWWLCPRIVYFVSRFQAIMRSINVVGARFPMFLFVVELTEIAIQTAQGYRSSTQVASVYLNLLFGVLICINCCSTPIVHYIWGTRKRQELLGRLVCVVVDGLLDFVWNAALQGYTFLRSAYQIDNTSENTEEFMGSVIEQVMVVSFTNLAFSVVPFLLTLLGLMRLRTALSKTAIVSSAIPSQVKPWKPTSDEVIAPRHAPNLTAKWLHIALGVYGIAILLLSMLSVGLLSSTPILDGRCFGILFPWGRGPTCAAHNINCTDWDIVGRREELFAVFQEMVPSVEHALAIFECPEFEMPTLIPPFSNLAYLIISDSTIVGWPDEAAMTTIAPQLLYLTITNVSFECEPTGLVHLPESVSLFALTEVVDAEMMLDIADIQWTALTFFSCNGCNLTSVPHAIHEMSSLDTAFLDYNLIESFPEKVLGQKNVLEYLSLVANPINDLPETLWEDLPAMGYVYVDFTNISTVPRLSPTTDRASPVVFANSTPLCEKDDDVSDQEWPIVVCQNAW